MTTQIFKFNQQGLNEAKGWNNNFRTTKIASGLICVLILSSLSGLSALIVIENSIPLTTGLGKLIIDGFAFKTLTSFL